MKKRIIAASVILAAVVLIFALNFESVEQHYAVARTGEAYGTVTLSVDCTELVENSDYINNGTVPEDGVIIAETECAIAKGDTAFDVLKNELDARRIHFDYTTSYVKGINNVYEYDCGDLSGWMYSVNGVFPTVSSAEYVLEDGDVVRWRYTCDLGRDVGDTYYTLQGATSDER